MYGKIRGTMTESMSTTKQEKTPMTGTMSMIKQKKNSKS